MTAVLGTVPFCLLLLSHLPQDVNDFFLLGFLSLESPLIKDED